MDIPPTLILSLDCEGKWGMADRLRPYHHSQLTSPNLVGAYQKLLALFASYEIPATFAFVMAFTLTRAERSQFPVLDPSRDPKDKWLGHYWRCIEEGLADGWHEPDAFELVRAAKVHEIASHCFCHRPLGDWSITPAGARQELADAAAAALIKKIELKTLVFPRNEVGNLKEVRQAGYIGYRCQLPRPGGTRGKAAALLDEFNVAAGPQPSLGPVDGLVPIPSGHFFNWRFALRRMVPPAVTRARWRSQLRQCVRRGGVVHLWLHPHNLLTGPGTAEVLSDVLADAARLRDRGQIQVLTQKAYCERILGAQTRP